MKALTVAGLVFLLLMAMTGCSEPPLPPEVQLVLNQAEDLRRSGADPDALVSYAEFLAALQESGGLLASEQARLTWLRDYASVAASYRATLAQGEEVRRQLEQLRRQQDMELLERSVRIRERLHALRALNEAIRDKRLNKAGNLARIEVLLTEADRFASQSLPADALARLAGAEALLNETVESIRPMLSSYVDKAQIARWKALVDDVIAENRRRGGYAIVINKLRRQLVLYHKGAVTATYPVGLGFKPIGDKLYAGDRATPEGRYQVTAKLPNSTYYRALLINYPNAEDQRRFAEARRRKLIPANATIGGAIEIHGGGKDSVTLGCIGLEDKHMLDLFNRIQIGTPVVIVGATSSDNLVRLALGRLQ